MCILGADAITGLEVQFEIAPLSLPDHTGHARRGNRKTISGEYGQGGSAVKVELSQDQFEALMELVFLGDWMINGIRVPGEHIERYEKIAQYIYSLAPRFGLETHVEFDRRMDKRFPTGKFDERMQEFIGEYDDQAFWDELVDRMADRDFDKMYGDAVEAMSSEMLFEKRYPFIEQYENEFAEHGIERLEIPTL